MKNQLDDYSRLVELLFQAHLKASALSLEYTCHKLSCLIDNVKTSRLIHAFELEELERKEKKLT